MNRLMMLALAMCLPFGQACDDTLEIKNKAEWVCQHTHILDEIHALDLYPEAHPIRDYVVDADVDFTESALEANLSELRDIGRGWDLAMERGVMATGRVAAKHASCEVDTLRRIALGERYRVELTLDYEVPNADAPLGLVARRSLERFFEDEGLGDLLWLLVTKDIASMVPPLAEIERVFAEEWDREKVMKRSKKVTFDMVREDDTWKAELDLRVDRSEDAPEPRAEVPEVSEDAEDMAQAWEHVTSRWRRAVEESRERVERTRTGDGEREQTWREVRKESREVRVGRESDERALRERIERLEREVRRLERQRGFEGFDDDVDIEIRF